MEDGGAWGVEPAGRAVTEDDGLVSLLDRTARKEPFERVVVTPVVCRWCGWDRFEVAAAECFCEGCCLPMGLADGDVCVPGSTWKLAPPVPPVPRASRVFRASADPVCPAGHDVFQVAVARVLAASGRVGRL